MRISLPFSQLKCPRETQTFISHSNFIPARFWNLFTTAKTNELERILKARGVISSHLGNLLLQNTEQIYRELIVLQDIWLYRNISCTIHGAHYGLLHIFNRGGKNKSICPRKNQSGVWSKSPYHRSFFPIQLSMVKRIFGETTWFECCTSRTCLILPITGCRWATNRSKASWSVSKSVAGNPDRSLHFTSAQNLAGCTKWGNKLTPSLQAETMILFPSSSSNWRSRL